ncbi:MAG: galactose-1-phosphate uridylyltransferase [Deltaproteobacteria bacterium]|nr:galactose-1-phosphate uridylyltransferase [Deltaproteobacteria bacterium]
MPELRKDPVMGRWVIIATERSKRPHDFTHGGDARRGGPCGFCAGHELETPPEVLAYRSNGNGPDTAGWSVRVVPNKFPALRIEGELGRHGEGLYDLMNGLGAHEVVIETPDHDSHLADLQVAQVEEVLWAYRDRILDLRKDRRFRFILIFKNHGAEAGASLEHSHSQLIALPIVPLNVAEELQGAREYFQYKERCVFCDIVRQETESGVRLVAENADFITVCPFAPRFPLETWILPKQHGAAFENATKYEYHHLAQALRDALRRLNRVLDRPPFNYMIHSLPLQDSDSGYYHWHLEIIPKLTKVAGFEWGTGFYINPTPPEEAARALREAGES